MKECVIVDIDGTISKVGDRIKYLKQGSPDWDAFYASSFDDEPIFPIINLVTMLYYSGHEILFFTARRDCCRVATEKWIKNYFPISFLHSGLFMRDDKDHRPDDQVKPEFLLKAGITDKSEVSYIIEDRNSMVKKWRELGFTVLQPAEGDF